MLLFGALPGGPELLIILLVLLLLFGPLVAVVVFLLNRSGGNDDEVAEMKARIDELEAELAAEEARGERESAETGDTDEERPEEP
jgi:sec-independent protein translocase protein TatA